MDFKNHLCVVPFVKSWVGYDGTFRNCCVAEPQMFSKPGQTFDQWWDSDDLNKFRSSLDSNELPQDCRRCALKESVQNESLRTVINKSIDRENTDFSWPSRWDIKFGSKCNLACWTCDENSSTLIQSHKKKIKILPVGFKDPELDFDKNWKNIKLNFLKSYDFHDVVTITVVGGEPMFNKKFLLFLKELVDLGFSKRTRLEIHTNGTHFNKKIKDVLSKELWNYVCIFVSVDAIGIKSTWLRYGSDWQKINNNIKKFQKIADYIEIDCVLSILNINNLIELTDFCNLNNLKLQITPLTHPEFMSLESWYLDKDSLCNKHDLINYGYVEYYNLIGSKPDQLMYVQLQEYIKSFNGIREPLTKFDKNLATALGLDKI